jgi:tetratricopeptide (TPR) repeat protein
MLSFKPKYCAKALMLLLVGSVIVGCAEQLPEATVPKSKWAIAANRKLQSGDLKGALKDYDQALSQVPKDADTYVNRGIVQDELGQHKAAIADYTKALALKPNQHLAYYNRANAQLQLKQYPGAIADYSKAIELEPDYAYAYANRGTAHLKAGKPQEALNDFQKASDIFADKNDPKNMQRVQRLLNNLKSTSNSH